MVDALAVNVCIHALVSSEAHVQYHTQITTHTPPRTATFAMARPRLAQRKLET